MKKTLTLVGLLGLVSLAYGQSPKPLASPKPELAASPKPESKGSPAPAASPLPAGSPSPAAVASSSPAPVASAPPPVVVVVREKEPEPKNDGPSLIAGWIGLAVLAVGGLFGFRYLKNRGMTVTGAFKQLGVELPKDAPPAAAPVSKPVVAPLPPLPSLSDLPAAGAAATGVAVGAVAPAAPPLPAPTGQPKLVGIRGPVEGKVIPLFEMLSVGREPDNTLPLPADTTVSRKHAIFLPAASGAGWEVSDCGSSNGTFVNAQRLSAPQVLSHGDEIKIGASRLRYEA